MSQQLNSAVNYRALECRAHAAVFIHCCTVPSFTARFLALDSNANIKINISAQLRAGSWERGGRNPQCNTSIVAWRRICTFYPRFRWINRKENGRRVFLSTVLLLQFWLNGLHLALALARTSWLVAAGHEPALGIVTTTRRSRGVAWR